MDYAILDALDALKQKEKARRREEFPRRLAFAHFNWWRRLLHVLTFFNRDYIDFRFPFWIRLMLGSEDACHAYTNALQERFGDSFQVYVGRPVGYIGVPYNCICIYYYVPDTA